MSVDATIQSARDALKDVLTTAFKELGDRAELKEKEEKRLFFPNGIELISITVKVYNIVDVTFKVAGEKGISGLLESEEIGEGLTGEVAQEVTEEK